MSFGPVAKRGYKDISKTAMELLVVEKVRIPPPRNKKPIAKLTYNNCINKTKLAIQDGTTRWNLCSSFINIIIKVLKTKNYNLSEIKEQTHSDC